MFEIKHFLLQIQIDAGEWLNHDLLDTEVRVWSHDSSPSRKSRVNITVYSIRTIKHIQEKLLEKSTTTTTSTSTIQHQDKLLHRTSTLKILHNLMPIIDIDFE